MFVVNGPSTSITKSQERFCAVKGSQIRTYSDQEGGRLRGAQPPVAVLNLHCKGGSKSVAVRAGVGAKKKYTWSGITNQLPFFLVCGVNIKYIFTMHRLPCLH